MLSDEKLKWIAEYIIMSHAEDIEFLSVCEMLDDELKESNKSLSDEQQHELALKLDKLIRSAKIIVTFPGSIDATS